MKDSKLDKISVSDLRDLKGRVVFGRNGPGGKRGSVAVKFRNPSDPAQTWTGRGRKPLWLARAGGNIERFRVS